MDFNSYTEVVQRQNKELCERLAIFKPELVGITCIEFWKRIKKRRIYITIINYGPDVQYISIMGLSYEGKEPLGVKKTIERKAFEDITVEYMLSFIQRAK
jgi:hypothetical protein